MQAGQLEASYAIKFGIRLGNDAAETYEMVNTVCRQAIMSWAVFNVVTTGSRRARKQVKREESGGSDRNIRMPELVDNILHISGRGPSCISSDDCYTV